MSVRRRRLLACPSPKALIPTVSTLFLPRVPTHGTLADTCSEMDNKQTGSLLWGQRARTEH